MAITAVDIKEAAFTSVFTDVEDLNLSNRGAVDAGALSQVTNLTALNLSFNALTSAHGLSKLTKLSNLNISHNQLVSLKGLPALTALTVLNLASNKLSTLGSLSECAGLKDLWLQHNQIKGLEELQNLASLTSLNRLILSPNPICKAIPAAQYRLAILASCSSLQVLDAQAVSEEERTAASSFSLPDLLSSINSSRSGNNVHALISNSTSSSTSHLQSSIGQGKGRSSSGQASPSSTSHRTAGLGPGLPGTRGMGLRMLPRKPPSAPNSAGGTEVSGGGGGGVTRTLSSSVLEAMASGPSFGCTASSPAGSLNGTRRTVGAGRRASLPLRLPKATNLEGTQFQAVLDALPVFDPGRLPSKAAETPWRDEKKAHKVVVETAQSAYECRYPTAHGRAVTVRTDGSLSASWPNGDLLANVDVDHASGAFSMLAMYRSGSVAVSWHSEDGGFVQYPTGNILLMVGASGGGTRYGPNGAAEVRWGPAAASEQAAPPCVDVVLDAHTALSYTSATRRLRLFWSVDDVRYEAVCGCNSGSACWDAQSSGVPAVALQLLQGGIPKGTKRRDVQATASSRLANSMIKHPDEISPVAAVGVGLATVQDRPVNAAAPVLASPDQLGALISSSSLASAVDSLQAVEVS